MEPGRGDPGRKNCETEAPAALARAASGQKRKSKAAPAASACRGSGSAAAALYPFRRNNGTAAASSSPSMSSLGVADSPPIEARRSCTGFNSHGGGGFRLVDFRSLHLHLLLGVIRLALVQFLLHLVVHQIGIQHGKPVHTPPGGFMGILNSQANMHFVGDPSHYAPFKAPRFSELM